MTFEPPPEPSAAAAADLAQRLDIAAEEIEVVSLEEVTWRDASLGNPQPGRMYAQVLVPGHRILLSAGDQQYEYHSGGDRPPVLCEDASPEAPTD